MQGIEIEKLVHFELALGNGLAAVEEYCWMALVLSRLEVLEYVEIGESY